MNFPLDSNINIKCLDSFQIPQNLLYLSQLNERVNQISDLISKHAKRSKERAGISKEVLIHYLGSDVLPVSLTGANKVSGDKDVSHHQINTGSTKNTGPRFECKVIWIFRFFSYFVNFKINV